MARIKYKEAFELEPGRGKPSIGMKPSEPELRKLYIKESKSIREVAEVLNCSKDMVYRALKEYEIERNPGFKRSKLREYKHKELRRKAKEIGASILAEELGVHVTTLRRYMKKKLMLYGE